MCSSRSVQAKSVGLTAAVFVGMLGRGNAAKDDSVSYGIHVIENPEQCGVEAYQLDVFLKFCRDFEYDRDFFRAKWQPEYEKAIQSAKRSFKHLPGSLGYSGYFKRTWESICKNIKQETEKEFMFEQSEMSLMCLEFWEQARDELEALKVTDEFRTLYYSEAPVELHNTEQMHLAFIPGYKSPLVVRNKQFWEKYCQTYMFTKTKELPEEFTEHAERAHEMIEEFNNQELKIRDGNKRTGTCTGDNDIEIAVRDRTHSMVGKRYHDSNGDQYVVTQVYKDSTKGITWVTCTSCSLKKVMKLNMDGFESQFRCSD